MDKFKSLTFLTFSTYKKTAGILIIISLALAIPFTLTFLGQNQDIRQRASETNTCTGLTQSLERLVANGECENDQNTCNNLRIQVQDACATSANFSEPQIAQTNVCGDGICQEITCLGLNCPAAETFETCPQDCKQSSVINSTNDMLIKKTEIYTWNFYDISGNLISSNTVTIEEVNSNTGAFFGNGFMNDIRDNLLSIIGNNINDSLSFGIQFSDKSTIQGTGAKISNEKYGGSSKGTGILSSIVSFDVTKVLAIPTPLANTNCNSCTAQNKPYLCNSSTNSNTNVAQARYCSASDLFSEDGTSLCTQCPTR